MRLVVFFLCTYATLASAGESVGKSASWNGTLYGYSNHTSLRNDSLLNPGNTIARMPQRSDHLEARLNIKAENQSLRFTARPIVTLREERNAYGATAQQEAYLSQWQLRLKASDYVNLSAGREVLNWGAAQFRSPSSPFYFNNGRSNPMSELSGMDILKASLTTDDMGSLYLVKVLDSGYASQAQDPWRNSWLLKYDQYGDDWAAGLVGLKAANRAAFYSMQGQYTVNDGMLIYGELASSTQTAVLNSPADITLPYSITPESARKSTGLLGWAYTLQNGQSIIGEYLHDENGYNRAEQRAYFQRASAQPGIALGLAPRLLGRDYLHLVWQSNLMESEEYWRWMLTHGITSGDNELAGYGEYSLNPHLSAFMLGVLTMGSSRQEFSALQHNSITAGLKIVFP